MRTIKHDIKRKDYNVYLMGDIHEGRRGVAYNKLDAAIGMIKEDKGSLVCLMGDLIEGISINDPRYSPYEQEGRYSRMTEQCKSIADRLIPIKKQIVSLLVGNHEEKLDKIMNCGTEIGDRLGLKFHTDSRTNICMLSDGLRFYLTHGSGSCSSSALDDTQREYNECKSIRNKLVRKAGDCVLMAMGHVHKLRIRRPPSKLTITRNDDGVMQECYPGHIHDPVTGFIPEDHRWYCSTGSFVEGYLEGADTYVERAGYDPTELGFIKVSIRNRMVYDVEKILI